MQRIQFREKGNVGDIIEKSAKFIRQNFLSVIKASWIIFIPYILGSILLGTSISGYFKMFDFSTQGPGSFDSSYSFLTTMVPGYILVAISYMMFYIICVSYIKHYVNGTEVITHNTVMEDLGKHFLKVLLGGILVGLITYIGIFLCVIPGIYFAVVFSHLFVIAIVEGGDFGMAFSKSFNLIKGKWWDSFLLYFLATLIVMAISFLAILPMYLYMGLSVFRNIDPNNPDAALDSMTGSISWFMPLYVLLYLVTTLITATIQSINYYNLVEHAEGIGEKEEIESIGS